MCTAVDKHASPHTTPQNPYTTAPTYTQHVTPSTVLFLVAKSSKKNTYPLVHSYYYGYDLFIYNYF